MRSKLSSERSLHLIAAGVVQEAVVRGIAGEEVGPADEVEARRPRARDEAHAADGIPQHAAPELGLADESLERLLGAETIHLAVHAILEIGRERAEEPRVDRVIESALQMVERELGIRDRSRRDLDRVSGEARRARDR